MCTGNNSDRSNTRPAIVAWLVLVCRDRMSTGLAGNPRLRLRRKCSFGRNHEMKVDPKTGEFPERSGNPLKAEELAPAEKARVVVDRHLTDSKSSTFDSTHEFNGDAAIHHAQPEGLQNVLSY